MIEKQEIKENETVTMTESLTVIGDVKSGAKISLQSKTPCQLIVQGVVHKDVEINWRGSITFEQNFLGNNNRIVNYEGDITAKNLGENTYLKTHKGNLSIGLAATNSNLISHSGNITVGTLSKSNIRAHQGNVTVTTLNANSTLIVHQGNVTVTTLNDNSTLIVYQGNVTIKKLVSSGEETTIKIYKGDLFISEKIDRSIINNENQPMRPIFGC